MDQLLGWASQGALKPHIHRVYRFDEIAQALTPLPRGKSRARRFWFPDRRDETARSHSANLSPRFTRSRASRALS
jgi:hypothetical protein